MSDEVVSHVSNFLRRIKSQQPALRRRKVTRRPKKRLMRRWVYGSEEVSNNFMENTRKDVFIGASDVSDYIVSRVAMERDDRGISTYHESFTILKERELFMKMIDQSGLRRTHFDETHGIIIEDETLSYFKYSIHSSSIQVDILGDHDFVQFWYEKITDNFEIVQNVIEWLYSTDGQSIEVPLRADRVPIDEMYPWLGDETLASYYDRFMASEASILLLIGPPGTGKTTFIRGLLQHTKESAIVTYDANILSKDYVFANFIEGDRAIMVIEDADNFLGNRTEGNGMMHKFLNVGDGLVSTKNKKMIFSTNLPSIKDIDPALIRPGRCFDIVNFSSLTKEQADKLSAKIGVTYNNKDDGNYSIAEIFNAQTHAAKAPRKRSMGFV